MQRSAVLCAVLFAVPWAIAARAVADDAAPPPTAQTPTAQTPTAQTPTAQTPTAQTPTGGTPPAEAKSAETPSSPSARYVAQPDDKAAFAAFMNESVRGIAGVLASDPAAAESKLSAMKATLARVQPTTEEGKRQLAIANQNVGAIAEAIELARASVQEIEAQLDANPHDMNALSRYLRKVLSEVVRHARTAPDQAETLLKAANARIDNAASAAADTEKQTLDQMRKAVARYQSQIDAGKKLTALIGKDAAPLEVEAWVNGTALSDADLKGKVVLLDFWAVWCGPCIATFPHLREWHEKYGEKGLVIIGLTNYYNYKWDTEKDAPQRVTDGKVSGEDEQQMLAQFARLHNLRHRLAVQSPTSTTAEFYGVTGIPHVVVIDQAGKIQMMRVGSGDQNAKDIGEMIEKLIANPAVAAGS